MFVLLIEFTTFSWQTVQNYRGPQNVFHLLLHENLVVMIRSFLFTTIAKIANSLQKKQKRQRKIEISSGKTNFNECIGKRGNKRRRG